MDPRVAVQRLLELDEDGDADLDRLAAHLDDTALELLTALCHSLSLATAVACGKSHRRGEAREQAAECVAGINMILEVWQMADVEVVDGPGLEFSILGQIPPD